MDDESVLPALLPDGRDDLDDERLWSFNLLFMLNKLSHASLSVFEVAMGNGYYLQFYLDDS